jgi:hypothetical protein
MGREVEFIVDCVAEGVGFEPTVAFTTPVFKTGSFGHSDTPPNNILIEKRLALLF